MSKLRAIILLTLGTVLTAHAASLALADRWVYCSMNLLVDKNVDDLEQVMRRAAQAGYTGIMLADSKFGKLGDMDPRYFRNAERVKTVARELKLDIIPTVFPVGYSEAILWHDPNLAEALPVKDALFVVHNGAAHLEYDHPVRLKGGDFTDLKQWGWADPTITQENGTIRIRDVKNQNARVSQQLKLQPFRQYHFSVRIRTQGFQGTPEVKVLAGSQGLAFSSLGVPPTQEWRLHHVVFNTLENTNVTLYLGSWGSVSGSIWFDDASLEEVGLLNVVRREGAPLVVKREGGGPLVEGRDFQKVVDPQMGMVPWKGGYEVWHEPPLIKTSLPNETRLRVSYYHAITVNDGQSMICPSEPKTVELLRDQAKRMHQLWGAKGYMMSHDEIRVLNWCAACQKRHLDAGALLADNLKTCTQILRAVNPSGKIYVWNDMVDPTHNAHANYYLVRGDLKGSWEGLDRDVIVVDWNFGKRNESLKFFAERGNPMIIAGYYDHNPEQITQWLDAAKNVEGVTGVMYTTWQHKFGDLEKFSATIKKWENGD